MDQKEYTIEELRALRDATKRTKQVIPHADRKILAERHLVGKESLRKLGREYNVSHEAIRYAIKHL
jgi:DNA-directed RNA polymerase sigma subunit (sigma70/sigma32)